MAISASGLRAGRAIIELALAGERRVERSLKRLQARTQRISRSFMSLGTFGLSRGGGFAGLASLRTLFVGTAAGAAIAWPVKMAANIEVAAAGMSVFTGSIKSARNMLMDLQQFSAISLVPFENMASQAKMLLQFGVAIDQVVPSVKSLAVLASGNSDEFSKLALAFAQVSSAGRLQGEEMRQFKNTAFNPLREISERTGETMLEVRKRMEAGKVSFDEVRVAMIAATSAGGRFGGLLQTISNTLSGKLNKALAQFKLAILPIGEQLLKPLTVIFRALNDSMDVFAAFIKKHKQAVLKVAAVLFGVAATATAFVTLGLAISLAAIAVSGFIAVFSVIGTVLGTLFSLPVIGAAVFLKFTNAIDYAKESLKSLATYVMEKFKRLTAIFREVAEAMNGLELSKGVFVGDDLGMKQETLWAGLRLAFVEVTNELKVKWLEFKNWFLGTIDEIVTGFKVGWLKVQQFLSESILHLSNIFMNWVDDVRAFFTPLLKVIDQLVSKFGDIGFKFSDTIGLSSIDAALREQARGFSEPILRAANKLQIAQAWAESVAKAAGREADMQQAMAGQAEDLQEAIDEWELAKTKAWARGEFAKRQEVIDAAQGKVGAQAAGDALEFARNPEGLFDARFAKQIFGKPQDEQVKILGRIEKNTRTQGFGGFPVV